MTLIDKAEALAAIEAWFAETKSFAPPSLLDAIAAIPARGVGADAVLDAAHAYLVQQYGHSALAHPIDRARILALITEKPHDRA